MFFFVVGSHISGESHRQLILILVKSIEIHLPSANCTCHLRTIPSANRTCHLHFEILICTRIFLFWQFDRPVGANQASEVQMASAICTSEGANGECNLHFALGVVQIQV